MKIGKIKFSICTFQFAISNITGDVMEGQAPRVNACTCVNGRHALMDALASRDATRQWTASPVLATYAYPARVGAHMLQLFPRLSRKNN